MYEESMPLTGVSLGWEVGLAWTVVGLCLLFLGFTWVMGSLISDEGSYNRGGGQEIWYLLILLVNKQ